jgi:glycosyltransferase involved in cell wall biosynthesis
LEFSLIIPSYNNADELMKELPGLIDFLKNNALLPEVIVVDDGSSAAPMLSKFCLDHGFLLFQHDTNEGKGAAVRTGMLGASKNIRVFTDADIPFQYNIFPEIMEVFRNSNALVVAGDRRKSDYFSKTPWVRRIGSNVFSMLVNIIMLRDLGDTQCGIKAFRASVVPVVFKNQKIKGFAADIEWLFRASKNDLKIHWVKAEFRNAGQSSVVFWKQAIRMLRDVVRLRFNSIS